MADEEDFEEFYSFNLFDILNTSDSVSGSENVESPHYDDEEEICSIKFEEDEVLTLSEICLERIKSNFDRYNDAFFSTQDAVLKRNLNFLQRRYTEELLSSFRTKKGMPSSYLDFLFNENLKNVHLEDFKNCSDDDVLLLFEKNGENIVSLCSGNISDSGSIQKHKVDFLEKIIVQLPNLKEAYFTKQCTDETLNIIAKNCIALEQLHLIQCFSVTDKGLKFLYSNAQNGNNCLKILSIRDLQVEESTIASLLSNIPSLEVLDHDYVFRALHSLHKDDVLNNTLNKINQYNLRVIDARSPFYDIDCRHMLNDAVVLLPTACPNLRELSTYVFSEEHLHELSQFSQLEVLKLETPNFDRPFMCLKKYPVFSRNLREIALERFSLSVAGLILSFSKVHMLTLINIDFENSSNVIPRNRFSGLHKLSIKEIVFEDKIELQIEALLNLCPYLEHLKFVGCTFLEDPSDISSKLARFASRNTLLELSFSWTVVTKEVIANILLSCKSLRSLIVEYCDSIKHDEVLNLYEIARNNKVKIHFKEVSGEMDLRSTGESDFDIYSDYDYEFEYDNDYDDSYSDYS